MRIVPYSTGAGLSLRSLVEYCIISDDDHRGRGHITAFVRLYRGRLQLLIKTDISRSASPPDVTLFPSCTLIVNQYEHVCFMAYTFGAIPRLLRTRHHFRV
jgi:hypothetical protein